jgi:hypothetical protein
VVAAAAEISIPLIVLVLLVVLVVVVTQQLERVEHSRDSVSVTLAELVAELGKSRHRLAVAVVVLEQ